MSDVSGIEPRRRPSAAGGASQLMGRLAGAALAMADPVYTASTGRVRVLDGSAQAVRSFIGFCQQAAAANGDPTKVAQTGSVASGFAGLTPGHEIYVSGSSVIDQDDIAAFVAGATAGTPYRSAGVAKSATEIDVRIGPYLEVP